jgi:hypothetical protein
MRKEDAGGGLGPAEAEDRTPQVEAGEAEGGATELDCQEMVTLDTAADAGVTAKDGPAQTKEAITTEVFMSHLATDEVAAGESLPLKRPLARLARKIQAR